MPFRATPVERINDAITSASLALAERARLRTEVARSKAMLSLKNERVRRLKARLREQERRFHQFGRVTPTRLIHGVLGTLEARRKDEYEEWLRIREALLHAMSERDAQVEEVKRLQVRWAYLDKAPDLLAAALEQKSNWLRKHDREASERLGELDAGERELYESLRRIERAVEDNRRRAAGPSRPALMRQIAMLQDLYERKQQRLQELWRERRALLCDGARMAQFAPASLH